MTSHRARIKDTVQRCWPIVVALLLGLASTCALARFLWLEARQADQGRFDRLTHLVLALYDDKVEKYEQVVTMIRDFFYHERLPSQKAWGQELDRLKLHSHYPSLVEAGCAVDLTTAEFLRPPAELLRAMPENCPLPANPKGHLKTLTLLYSKVQPPLSPYEMGFDVRDEPKIKDPVLFAEYRNSPSISGGRTLGLRAGTNTLYGFYMVRAIYDDDLPVETPRRPDESEGQFFQRMIDDRNPHVRGAVFAAIDMDRLLREALKDTELDLTFEIFDGRNPEESHRLNQFFAIPEPEDRVRRLDLTNRTLIWKKYIHQWAITFHPTPEFERHSPRRTAWVALGAGLAITLCFTALVWLQSRRRMGAEAHARQIAEAREVIESLARERAQVSRDLHDGVLQSLYALGLGMRKMRKTIRPQPDLAEQRCQQNLEALELAMSELRRHLGKSGPQPSTDLDLAFALGRLTEVMNRQGNVPVEYSVDHGLSCRPKPGLALQMMLLAREAISNAQRHSGANLIRVRLQGRQGGLDMLIEDQGGGFDSNTSTPGNGLRNMADRAHEIGADYQFDAQTGEGVRIRVHLPAARCVSCPSNSTAR